MAYPMTLPYPGPPHAPFPLLHILSPAYLSDTNLCCGESQVRSFLVCCYDPLPIFVPLPTVVLNLLADALPARR